MWGVYDYDLPRDLGARLLSAGFVEASASTVMIAESARVAEDPILPDATELVHIRDEAGVDLLIAVHESVFAHDHQDLAGRSFGVCTSRHKKWICSSSWRGDLRSPHRELSTCPRLSSPLSGAAAPSRSGEEKVSIERRYRAEPNSPPGRGTGTSWCSPQRTVDRYSPGSVSRRSRT